MRLFFGILLPAATRDALARELAARAPLPGRLSLPENWHVTLFFMGEVTAERAAEMIAAARTKRWPTPFLLHTGQLDAFPSVQDARICWLGLMGELSCLLQLQREVSDLVQSFGLEPEARGYSPHVTLSRIKGGSDVQSHLRQPLKSHPFRVDQLALFQSRPGPHGSSYEVLATFALNAERPRGPGGPAALVP